MPIYDQKLLARVLWHWHGACDIASDADASAEPEMTEERLLALARDPTCEMQGFIGGKGGYGRSRTPRGNDGDDFRIMDMIGQFPVKDTDPEIVRVMLTKETFNIEAMVQGQTVAQMTMLNALVDKNERTIANDTSIKAIAEFDPDMKRLQERLRATHGYAKLILS